MIEFPGIAKLWDALPEARIAGGAVRDFLAGKTIADVDFAAPLPPATVMARLQASGIKSVPTGLAHGTVTAVIDGSGFEITTLRRDLETDGRHAKVAFTDDWQEDASRRDFTINAMSMDRAGTVFDYFGGKTDLAAGRVRFVGAAILRIREDYLRILRFFRFFARYGFGEADRAALDAIRQSRDGIKQLSVERIWSEMKSLLRAEDPRRAVALMQDTGVLAMVFPHPDVAALDALVARHAPADPLLRVAALSGRHQRDLGERLKLSGEERERLKALAKPNRLKPDTDEAGLRRALADEENAILIDRSWLGQDASAGWDALRTRIAKTERPVFPLQGRDVTALGMAPGPAIGEMLATLRDWWMAGGCIADAQTCLERLAEAQRNSR